MRYNDVPPEVYRGFGFPGADDMGNMYQFKRDFNEDFRRARAASSFSRRLDPELQTFDEWLEKDEEPIPLVEEREVGGVRPSTLLGVR